MRWTPRKAFCLCLCQRKYSRVMNGNDFVGCDIFWNATFWLNRYCWFENFYRMDERTTHSEDRESQEIVPNYEGWRWILNYFSGRRWLWRSQCATSTMPCRQLCLENERTLTPPSGQLSIPVLSLFSKCNYHNSLPNKLFRISVQFLFYFLHVLTLDGVRMKFLDYTDEIREGDTVIVYISSDDLKQIIIKKGETYQSKFG